MSALSIQVPFPVFQGRDGQPLENGYVWIGEPNLNPQTNPVVAYFDAALTIPAPQPLRTLNGYVSRAGTPAQIYVDGVNFSILVQDSKGSMVYNFPDGTGISPDACGVTYNPPFTGAVPYPVCEKLAQVVSVMDFGAVGDGVTDDTAAIQAAIDASGQPESLTNPIPTCIFFPPGEYLIGSPLYIDALDGLQFKGSGIFTTRLLINNSFTFGTVPVTFPSDGLDYATPSLFIFARRRHSGKSGAFLVPGAAAGAGAAWWYKFSEMFVDLTSYSTGKAADFIRAPEIANLVVEDVVVNGGRNLINTDDALGMYGSTFRNVKMFYGERFLKAERGTTLLIDQCAAVHCDYGFKSRVNYSVYNACSVDHWGIGQYAWDLRGEGVVLNGCGCEYGYGGIFRAQTRGTDIVVNGSFFLGGSTVGDSNYTGQANEIDFGVAVGEMIYVSGAKVSFNRTMLRNVTEATPGTVVHLKATAANGGRVTIDGNTGEAFNEYLQPEDWNQVGFGAGTAATDASRIDWTGDKPQFALYITADMPIARNGTPQITFSTYDKPYDLGPSYYSTQYGLYPRTGTVTEYRVPTPGIYEFTFSAFIDSIEPGDYIFFSVTGETNRLMYLSDFPDDVNIGNQITLTARYLCNSGDIVRIFYRSFSTTVDPVIRVGSRFFGGMV